MSFPSGKKQKPSTPEGDTTVEPEKAGPSTAKTPAGKPATPRTKSAAKNSLPKKGTRPVVMTAKKGEVQPPLPDDLVVPAAPVLDPVAQQATFALLDPDLELELVAAEPLVVDPVVMDNDQ